MKAAGREKKPETTIFSDSGPKHGYRFGSHFGNPSGHSGPADPFWGRILVPKSGPHFRFKSAAFFASKRAGSKPTLLGRLFGDLEAWLSLALPKPGEWADEAQWIT